MVPACLAALALAATVHAAEILLVTGNSNGTVPEGGRSLGDAFIASRLESSLGHRVRVLGDSTPRAGLQSAAAQSDLVLVLESVTSTRLLDKLKPVAVPLLNCEAFIQDDLGLTATGPSGDPGRPDRFALGVVEGQTSVRIRRPDHPLAAGLSGTVAVYSKPKSINWGKVAPAVQGVATLADDSTGATLYLYRQGDRLFDGTTAAGLRVGLFLEDDNETGTPNLMTPEGLKLFDAAVTFALAGPTPTAPRLEPARATFSWFPRDFLGRLLPPSAFPLRSGPHAIRP